MNKLNRFIKLAFALTLFGPFIGLMLFGAFVEIAFELAGIIAFIGAIFAYLLLPLLPFTYSSIYFLSGVLLCISTEGRLPGFDSPQEFARYAIFTAVLILPFIGAFCVKSKPMVYRLFVYLPLLCSMVYTMFFDNIGAWWLKPFITDIVYLILAIILDIKISRERRRTT